MTRPEIEKNIRRTCVRTAVIVLGTPYIAIYHTAESLNCGFFKAWLGLCTCIYIQDMSITLYTTKRVPATQTPPSLFAELPTRWLNSKNDHPFSAPTLYLFCGVQDRNRKTFWKSAQGMWYLVELAGLAAAAAAAAVWSAAARPYSRTRTKGRHNSSTILFFFFCIYCCCCIFWSKKDREEVIFVYPGT